MSDFPFRFCHNLEELDLHRLSQTLVAIVTDYVEHTGS